MQTGHLCPGHRGPGPGPWPWCWPPGGAPHLFLQTEPKLGKNRTVGQGVAGSTSLPQLSPGPLAQGLVLEILPRAGTVHLKTPPHPCSISAERGGAALPLCYPRSRNVCPRSDLWVPFCPVPAGVIGVCLSWPLLSWGNPCSCGAPASSNHRSVPGALTALVSYCLSLYIFLIFSLPLCLCLCLPLTIPSYKMTSSFQQSPKYPRTCVGRFPGPTPEEFNPLDVGRAQEPAFHVNLIRLSPAENHLW